MLSDFAMRIFVCAIQVLTCTHLFLMLSDDVNDKTIESNIASCHEGRNSLLTFQYKCLNTCCET